MSGPVVEVASVPTGGVVILTMPEYVGVLPAPTDVMTIQRTTVLSDTQNTGWVTIYNGVPVPTFVDVGDVSADALFPQNTYQYTVTDSTGTTISATVQPTATLVTRSDGMTNLFIRMLRGALTAISRPPGVPPIRVFNAMPTRTNEAAPLVFVNLDLLQQKYVQIARDIIAPNNDNQDSAPFYCLWMWRVSIFGQNAEERDFIRDSIITIWNSLHKSVFPTLGYSMEHDVQAASYQLSQELRGIAPTFYGADVMCSMTGVFNSIFFTNYGIIETITTDAVYASGTFDAIEVTAQANKG
jgi:hypothetical protein